MNIECPYCGCEYETEVFELNPNDTHEEECPKCERYYSFEFYYEPYAWNVKKLEESELNG